MIGEGLISSQLKMKKTNKPGWKLLKFAAEKRKVRYTVLFYSNKYHSVY